MIAFWNWNASWDVLRVNSTALSLWVRLLTWPHSWAFSVKRCDRKMSKHLWTPEPIFTPGRSWLSIDVFIVHVITDAHLCLVDWLEPWCKAHRSLVIHVVLLFIKVFDHLQLKLFSVWDFKPTNLLPWTPWWVPMPSISCADQWADLSRVDPQPPLTQHPP